MAGEGDHRLQAEASWCVLACVEMVSARQGRPVSQQALAALWRAVRHGYALDDAADYLCCRVMQLDPTLPATFSWLELHLAAGAWVIAYVFVAPLVEFQAQHGQGLVSPYGLLAGNRHTIVLCGYSDGTYTYLDPFFSRAGQPYQLGREECVEVLQGSVVVVPGEA